MWFINLLIHLLNIAKYFFNHLINIPLNLLAGLGKVYVVLIAFFIDLLQATIYTKFLENQKISRKLSFLEKFFPSEEQIEKKPFFSKFRKLQYLGIFILASLPVYTGGICAAATLRHVSKNLNRTKSFIVMALGSLTGCIIWVLGINCIFYGFKKLLF